MANNYLNFVDSLPQTIGGVEFLNVYSNYLCPRRETGFQLIGFQMESATGMGLLVSSFKDSVRLGPYLIASTGVNDSLFTVAAGGWIEAGPDGVGIVAIYLTTTFVNPDTFNQVHCSTSVDYGYSWTDSVIYSDNAADYTPLAPQLITGQDGKLYVVYVKKDIVTEINTIILMISDDMGSSWTTKQVGTETYTIDHFSVCASPDTVYIAVAASSGALYKVIIYHTTDGGDNWVGFSRNNMGGFAAIACNMENLSLATNYDLAGSGASILKTTNAGAAIGITAVPSTFGVLTTDVPIMRSQGNIFACCYQTLRDGANELGYMLSEDDGDTWTLTLMTITYD